MNFGISVDSTGKGTMTWDKPTDISTNIWWSLNVDGETMFNNPNFGLRVSDIKKITSGNLAIIQQRVNQALKWLVDTGKATSIKTTVERDTTDRNRINWKVEAVQADGFPITVTSFRTIGGPSSTFSI